MARNLFGGSSDDYAVDTYGKPVTNRRVRFYTSAAMTTEITDLASDSAGTGSPLTVSTDAHGFWGPIYGPDAVTVMYAGAVDVSGNPPLYVVAVYTHTSGVGGVASFNTRTGAITLAKADVTGTGLAAVDVGADASGTAATVQTNLTTEVTRAQAAEAALGGGMQFRTAVVVATTNQALSGLPTVDGVTLTAGQVILLTAQTAGSQNGLWAVASGAWARPSNFAAGADATATSVLVESGSAGAGTTYAVTGTTSNVIGTNVLTFVKTSATAASGGVTWQTAITTNTTAVKGNGYPVNCTGGAVTLTLPASPTAGDQVGVYKTDTSTNVVTVAGTVDGQTNATILTQNAGGTLTYIGGSTGWKVTDLYSAVGPQGSTGLTGPVGQGGFSSLYAAGAVGQWYSCSSLPSTNQTLATMAVGTLVLGTPIIAQETITIDKIGCYLQTNGSAGALLRMGVYQVTGTNPFDVTLASAWATLLADGGTIAADAGAGGGKIITLGTPLTIAAGTAFAIGVVAQTNTSGVYRENVAGGWESPWGSGSIIGGSNGSLIATGVTGALPSTFTPSAFGTAGQGGAGWYHRSA